MFYKFSPWNTRKILFFFCFLGLHMWQMEAPRLGVELELHHMPQHMWDLSCICYLHQSSQQYQIPNAMSQARE